MASLDCRREHLGHAHRAEALELREIPAEVARHDAGLHARVERLGRHLGRHERLRGCARHRERPDLARGLMVDGHEAVAANAVHLGLAEPRHGADRRGGVEGVTALEQHLQPGRRGDGMPGRDEAVHSGHGGPGEGRTRRGRRLGRLLLTEDEDGADRDEENREQQQTPDAHGGPPWGSC
jgi:hypothetical protein